MGFDKVKYDNGYKKGNYDRVTILVPKGKRVALQDMARYEGLSVNQLIIRALEDYYNIDLSKSQY